MGLDSAAQLPLVGVLVLQLSYNEWMQRCLTEVAKTPSETTCPGCSRYKWMTRSRRVAMRRRTVKLAPPDISFASSRAGAVLQPIAPPSLCRGALLRVPFMVRALCFAASRSNRVGKRHRRHRQSPPTIERKNDTARASASQASRLRHALPTVSSDSRCCMHYFFLFLAGGVQRAELSRRRFRFITPAISVQLAAVAVAARGSIVAC